jgi:hypothetical protein
MAEPHIARKPRLQLRARFLGNVDKGYFGALLGEFLDESLADAPWRRR